MHPSPFFVLIFYMRISKICDKSCKKSIDETLKKVYNVNMYVICVLSPKRKGLATL